MIGRLRMDIDRVDPRLRAATERLRVPDPSKALLRRVLRLATRVMPVPKIEGVAVETDSTSGRAGRVRLRLYRPEAQSSSAALLWIHGGGLLYGDARQDEALCGETAAALGIVVVSVGYRFAPEHPFPAALDDTRAGWGWLLAHSAALRVDPGRIVIGGESAGGGLAAALVQRVHDEGGPQPIGQWLFAPMLDDRTAVDETLDAVEHWVWTNRDNRVGWSGYLPGTFGTDEVPPYAAASRRADLSGLPPAFIAVGDIELFSAEDVDYAARLADAGVSTTLDIVVGAPHGFENWARDSTPAQELMERARAWLHGAIRPAAP